MFITVVLLNGDLVISFWIYEFMSSEDYFKLFHISSWSNVYVFFYLTQLSRDFNK